MKRLNTKDSTKEKSSKLDKLLELSLLYDFYGALLKEAQREIFEDYVLNDLSLSEIAEGKEMTRQGVYDIVKRCSKLLENYEEKLCLIQKFDETKEMVNQINKAARDIRESGDITQIQEIERLSYRILDEF